MQGVIGKLVDLAIKAAPFVVTGACGWLAPRALNAWRNRGKTREDIAREHHIEALKRREAALSDRDPANDAGAIEDEQRARDELERVREERAFWEGFATKVRE